MKVAKSNEYEFLGVYGDYYVIRRMESDDIELVHHLKYVDVNTGLASMMTPNGKIEPTYYSRATADPIQLNHFIQGLQSMKYRSKSEMELDKLLVDILG